MSSAVAWRTSITSSSRGLGGVGFFMLRPIYRLVRVSRGTTKMARRSFVSPSTARSIRLMISPSKRPACCVPPSSGLNLEYQIQSESCAISFPARSRSNHFGYGFENLSAALRLRSILGMSPSLRLEHVFVELASQSMQFCAYFCTRSRSEQPASLRRSLRSAAWSFSCSSHPRSVLSALLSSLMGFLQTEGWSSSQSPLRSRGVSTGTSWTPLG
mmetsp:Transcript_36341/g.86308  ORF Transcript_36341/g.86308 Transcript_36341/m.86308 type:complete len:215 (+) Transcript_36341:410-1054(+)